MPGKDRLFDSLLDDEAFAAVLADVTRAVGARSFLGGFTNLDGSVSMLVSSGFWPDGLIEAYYGGYCDSDPWTARLLSDWKPFRAIDTRDLPEREIEGSELCEDLLRPMGDDTRFVTGVAVEDRFGIGSLGIHRGADQRDFSDEEIALIDRVAPDVARAMAIRCRLQGSERAILARDETLHTMRDGIMLLTADGRIRYSNAAAEAFLCDGGLLRSRAGVLVTSNRKADADLRAALARVTETRVGGVRLAGADGSSLDVSLLLLPARAGAARIMLTFAAAPPVGRARLLRELYGLSPTEAAVALLLADGLDPADIAEQRQTSRHTVRAQLRAIALKMECARQIDIVRRIAALPRLGGSGIS
ncbi:hypothetical protein AAW00_10000 [Aurantiacibacter luteus]|uniref:HTH luxR-type domain-containing protein n=2 Tax=Aurantiacibacter luteus TaxID=1581420 RepID=A0A0G9MUX5_9SPHN|nr:hypothetical protein AAW00_10000 [Aurantiacibacter luteus]